MDMKRSSWLDLDTGVAGHSGDQPEAGHGLDERDGGRDGGRDRDRGWGWGWAFAASSYSRHGPMASGAVSAILVTGWMQTAS